MLSKADKQRLMSQEMPPVVVIPDVRAKTPIQDLATELRAQLGVLE
jgi:hypothetical protein